MIISNFEFSPKILEIRYFDVVKKEIDYYNINIGSFKYKT